MLLPSRATQPARRQPAASRAASKDDGTALLTVPEARQRVEAREPEVDGGWVREARRGLIDRALDDAEFAVRPGLVQRRAVRRHVFGLRAVFQSALAAELLL